MPEERSCGRLAPRPFAAAHDITSLPTSTEGCHDYKERLLTFGGVISYLLSYVPHLSLVVVGRRRGVVVLCCSFCCVVWWCGVASVFEEERVVVNPG
jgi:hypothetical protein